jgi:hypothetical protein
LSDGGERARPARTFTEKCFLAVILTAAVLAVVWCFGGGVSGNDYWWHVKLGEWIWERGQVPATDVFSWYASARSLSFTPHEWLSDVLFYGLHRAFGPAGIFCVSLLAAPALIFLTVRRNIRGIFNNAALSAVFLTLFSVLTTLFFYGRPQIFSFYLLFAELGCLYRFIERPKSRAIFAVPLLGCLWSNLHGGSANLSYLLCLIFLACGAVRFDAGRLSAGRLEAGKLRTLAVITALTASATLVNPTGPGIFIYPYVNVGDKFMQAVISEWAAPDAKRPGDLILYYVPAFIVIGGLIASDKKVRLIDFALLAFFTLLFLRSVRFVMFFFIAASFFAFGYFPRWRLKEIRGRLEKAAVLMFFVLAGFGLVLGAVRIARLARGGELVSTAVSDEAVQAVREAAPRRLFNDYNFGEALIYGDVPVFFDGRADVYKAEDILKDGVSLLLLRPADGEGALDIDALLAKYGFDGFFISRSRPLYTYLASHPEKYRPGYSDGETAYFEAAK